MTGTRDPAELPFDDETIVLVGGNPAFVTAVTADQVTFLVPPVPATGANQVWFTNLGTDALATRIPITMTTAGGLDDPGEATSNDPTAAPARDWNSRIAADCYRPNAIVGNLEVMSWDLGPTLAGWMGSAQGDDVAYRGFVDGDRGVNGLAQPFHHVILPLAAMHDARTEIRWGLRDFAWRFGRPARGVWLPETAVDLGTLRLLADEGIEHTVLAPWQVEASAAGTDTRRPARIELGDGRSMVVAGMGTRSTSFERSRRFRRSHP